MRGLISEQLLSAAESAAGAGLDYLRSAVDSNGTWQCEFRRPDAATESMPSVFMAACGVLALEVCDDPRAREIAFRSREFIVSCIEHPGVWRFEARFELDLDDTALCSLAIGPTAHPWIFMGRNVDRLLAYRDGKGRFLTWMSPIGPLGNPNDADPVVNANVIAYLGERPETRGARRWVEQLIEENRECGASIWYGSPMDLYYGLSRAGPAFAGLKESLTHRILSAKLDDALQTANALSSLDMLNALEGDANARFAASCAERLIDSQLADGSWGSCEISQGPRVLRVSFHSRSMSAAYCVEALARLTRAGRRVDLPARRLPA